MLTLRAHAKVNLALSVGPPAPPRGYHPIASLFACIDLHDELTLARDERAGDAWLSIAWAGDAPRASAIDWPIEKDLCFRAHALLQERAGRALPVRAKLIKRTPVGGGLGGGSSDAASMLLGLRTLFDLRVSDDELIAIAGRLGSDIAFFIDGPHTPARGAIVTGFGERIERVTVKPRELLLLVPSFGCPTGAVYQAFDRAPVVLDEQRVRALVAQGVPVSGLFNDLASPACAVEPRVRKIIDELAGAGVTAHVTGSGSTMFVLDPRAGDGEHIGRVCPELVVMPARTVG
jgi:4-diphosphocytidyl-2-C-methyl-D-erythritol kinase